MIRIEKDCIIKDCLSNELNKISDKELPKYLGNTIEIGEDVTFGRIFDLLILNREFLNTALYSFTYGYDIDFYIDEIYKDSEEVNSDIEYYEVYRVFEHMIDSSGEEYNEYYYGIHGVSFDENGRKTNHALSFKPLCEIKNIPIRVNNELNITVDTGIKFNDVKTLSEKYKTLHKAQIPMTLFNFLGAIMFEMTFYGVPENRDIKKSELYDMVREIEVLKSEGKEYGKRLEFDEDGQPYTFKDGEKDYFLKDDHNEIDL